MALIKMKPTSPGTRTVIKVDRSHLLQGRSVRPADHAPEQDRRAQQLRPHHHAPRRRRLAPEVSRHRLQARQGRRRRRRRARGVRSEPYGAHRAHEVCGRRASLHYRRQGHEAGRRHPLGLRCAHQVRQRDDAASRAGRLDRLQRGVEARQRRPARAQRRQLRVVHGARRHLCLPASEVRRDPQGAHRLPRHHRRSEQRRAQPAQLRQGRCEALARRASDGARSRDEPGRPPARRWRGQVRPG